jgi:hypothetical protein
MSADFDNMIGTIPPGFLAPVDGNYAPNVAQGGSPAAVSGASEIGEEDEMQLIERLDANNSFRASRQTCSGRRCVSEKGSGARGERSA